jgi:dihydrofolate reductase
MIDIVVACDKNNGIGKDNLLPWHLPEDLNHFKNLTTYGVGILSDITEYPDVVNSVVMGRKTWESLPKKYRPLKNRNNVVITTNEDYKAEGAEVFHSLEEAFYELTQRPGRCFVIGGGEIYRQTIESGYKYRATITRILDEFDCDTFFPEIDDLDLCYESDIRISESNSLRYMIEEYE